MAYTEIARFTKCTICGEGLYPSQPALIDEDVALPCDVVWEIREAECCWKCFDWSLTEDLGHDQGSDSDPCDAI